MTKRRALMGLGSLAFVLGSCGVPAQQQPAPNNETPANALKASDSEEALAECQDVRDYLDEIDAGRAALTDAAKTCADMEQQIIALRAIALRGWTEGITDSDRASLGSRFESGVAALGVLSTTASYDGVGLLNGDAGAPVVAVDGDADHGTVPVPLADLTIEGLALDELALTDYGEAGTATYHLDDARNDVLDAQSMLYSTLEVLEQSETRLNRELIRCGLEDMQCVSASTSQCAVFLDDPVASTDIDPALEATAESLAEGQAIVGAGVDAVEGMLSALERMTELATEASGAMDAADRAAADDEFQSLALSLGALANSGTVNGIEMTTGDEDFSIGAWINSSSDDLIYVQPSDLSAEALGMDAGLNLTSESEAAAALSGVGDAHEEVYDIALHFWKVEVQLEIAAERVARAKGVWP